MTATTTPATDQNAAAPMFATSRGALADALATVGLAISTRPALPVMGGVLLEGHADRRMTLTGSDDTTVITLTLEGAAEAPGRILINHAEAMRLLSALAKGQPKRSADAQTTTIAAPEADAPTVTVGGYTVPLAALALTDYPAPPTTPPTVATLERERFTTELGRVLMAVGHDDTLPLLTAVNMEFDRHSDGLTLATTDRYRLAAAPLSGGVDESAPESILVPGALLGKLAPHLRGSTIEVGWRPDAESGVVALRCGAITAVVRAAEGQFPDWRARMPAQPTGSVTADRAELAALTEKARGVLKAKRDTTDAVALTVAPDALTVDPVLSERCGDVAAPTTAATTTGYDEPSRFGLNPAYLLDALSGIRGSGATIHTTGPTKPVVVTEAGETPSDGWAYRHLLAPVRLGD